MARTIAEYIALAGALLFFLAGFGVLRLADIYARMHAATKATTLGLALMAVAGFVGVDSQSSEILLAAAVMFVTAPAAAHFVARSAYRAEGIEIRLDRGDDLRSLLERREQD